MGDIVDCIAVLVKDEGKTVDRLYLHCPPDWKLRVIDCVEKGRPKPEGQRPSWEYEIKGDRLHVTPSLLCTDTQFHTDFNWSCAFVVCPEGTGGYDHFYSLNKQPE